MKHPVLFVTYQLQYIPLFLISGIAGLDVYSFQIVSFRFQIVKCEWPEDKGHMEDIF